MNNYIRQAKAAMAKADYAAASEFFKQAATCALSLAEKSFGKQREEYKAKCKTLLELKESAEKKAASAPSQKAPAPAAAPAPAEPGKDGKVESAGEVRADGKGQGGSQAGSKRRKSDPASPMWLSDYIGQPQAVTAVTDLIQAAKLRNSAVPHLILYGSHGLGKTTFANIIANEMGVGFNEVNVSKINVTEMISILKKIKPRDILFIDEIHTLPQLVAESVLYSAMQDGKITYMEGNGKYAKPVNLTLPPFTLIGATTEIGKLAKPFTQRAIQIRLEEYSDEVLGGIITNSFFKRGYKISNEMGLYISRRCRNNPRIANNMVKRISDKALVRFAKQNNLNPTGSLDSVDAIRKLGITVEQNVIDEFFEENGIDEWGLEKGDRTLLKIMIERYNGGPVGIDTLARVMNESNNVLTQKYEAYLVKKGLMRIDPAGRVVMPDAYKVLGLPPPEAPTSSAQQPPEGEKKPRFDERKVVACLKPDPIKCQKIDELITYPESAKAFTESLDELFPDIEKDYEGETKHLCFLTIDFDTHKRRISCDSFLESRFASCLAQTGYIKDIKAQSLELAYISQELANHRYFPDFLIKDQNDRLAIIEMKNFEMLGYHLNIDKYEQLKEYCISKGYGYAEIAKPFNGDKYVSVEKLKAAPPDGELAAHIASVIDSRGKESGEGIFTEDDWNEYVKTRPALDKSALITLLLNDRRLKNTDRQGNSMKIVFA